MRGSRSRGTPCLDVEGGRSGRRRWWRGEADVLPVLCTGLGALALLAMVLAAADGCPVRSARARRHCLGDRRAAALAPRRLETDGLRGVGFGWLRRRYGGAEVYAQQSSRTAEDTTNSDDGGLPEQEMRLSAFVDAISSGEVTRYNCERRGIRTAASARSSTHPQPAPLRLTPPPHPTPAQTSRCSTTTRRWPSSRASAR